MIKKVRDNLFQEISQSISNSPNLTGSGYPSGERENYLKHQSKREFKLAAGIIFRLSINFLDAYTFLG